MILVLEIIYYGVVAVMAVGAALTIWRAITL